MIPDYKETINWFRAEYCCNCKTDNQDERVSYEDIVANFLSSPHLTEKAEKYCQYLYEEFQNLRQIEFNVNLKENLDRIVKNIKEKIE